MNEQLVEQKAVTALVLEEFLPECNRLETRLLDLEIGQCTLVGTKACLTMPEPAIAAVLSKFQQNAFALKVKDGIYEIMRVRSKSK